MGERRGKVFLIGSEGIGRGDDTLGYEILMAMVKSLTERKDAPRAIIFWNTAVNLLAKESPVALYLKLLEERGVQLLAGQLCVRELGLTDKIIAGRVVTMNEILDLLLTYEVVAL